MNVGLDYKTSQIIHDGFGLCTVYCCFQSDLGIDDLGLWNFNVINCNF
jgi:hypothetical protein